MQTDQLISNEMEGCVADSNYEIALSLLDQADMQTIEKGTLTSNYFDLMVSLTIIDYC